MRRVTSPLILSYTSQLYTIGVTPATSNRELVTFSRALYPGRREWKWCTDNQVCRVSMERENNTRDQWLTVEEDSGLSLLRLLGGGKSAGRAGCVGGRTVVSTIADSISRGFSKPLKNWSRRSGLNGTTCHRFGPETCLTDSYKGASPLYNPTKGAHPLRAPQVVRSTNRNAYLTALSSLSGASLEPAIRIERTTCGLRM